MAILSLALYGSRARGDYNDSSDIDLFAITNEEHYRMIIRGNSNLACYPKNLAIERAKNGDLFILHICEESKEIYSNGFEINNIKSAFEYKKDYSYEKLCASDLAWFLIDFNSNFRDVLLLNKRIAWCVRTILIASSAEIKSPVFSKDRLVDFSGKKIVSELITIKESKTLKGYIFKDLQKFLIDYNLPKPKLDILSLNAYHELFTKTKNAMGLKTLMSISSDKAPFGYS